MGSSIVWFQSSLVWLGLVLSVYAIYVEYMTHHADQYKALCDISETVSCSKAFLSEYGKFFSYVGLVRENSILDVSNATYGMLFYIIYASVLSISGLSYTGRVVLLILSVLSMAMSAALSYILAVIMRDKCVICFLTYACNFGLFVCASLKQYSK